MAAAALAPWVPDVWQHPAIDAILRGFDYEGFALLFLLMGAKDAVGLAADEDTYRAVQGFVDASVPATRAGLTIIPVDVDWDGCDRLAWIRTVRGYAGCHLCRTHGLGRHRAYACAGPLRRCMSLV
jgi:hypothetical protein